jgi:L-lactate dehydrogenase complex protein LldF
MMRAWRMRDFARGNPPLTERLALKLWSYAARRPRLYHALARIAVRRLARAAGAQGMVRRFPFLKAWAGTRDLMAPEGETFHDLYAKAQRGKTQ